MDFRFLTEQNEVAYTTQVSVAQGTVASPVITEYTENVEGAAIDDLTLAEKVVVSVIIPSSNENLDGTINLQSKAKYYLEF